jgi:4-diphosphocytidyl-2-C-methyl-D-erythritol kinase
MSADAAFEDSTRRSARARAPGKVNLQLSVGPKNEDGYHPLATVFQAVDLYETVTAAVRNDGLITLTVEAAPGFEADISGVPLDDTNLAWRAALAVRAAYGITDGIDLHVVKGVPVAGGMAGGSADAAAALVACTEAWDCGATREDLLALGATLGADVPFAIMGHTAVGLGKGDELSPAMARGEFHWAFAVQSEGLSTPDVFARFDEQVAMGAKSPELPGVDAEVMAALMAGDPAQLGRALSNDLQDAALSLAPRLHGVMEAMEEAEALGILVSGSGPTIAALAASRQHALAIAAHVEAAGVAQFVVTASGPAMGTVILEG